MWTEHELLQLLAQLGVVVIFISLFCGIVGIPAPEETLLVIVGILLGTQKLALLPTITAVFFGVFCGMVAAYILGRTIGMPMLQKVLRFLKQPPHKLNHWEKLYRRNWRRATLLGLYIPVARQLLPYIAGVSTVPFGACIAFSALGSLLWTAPFVLLGYIGGQLFHIPLAYTPFIGIGIIGLYIGYIVFQKKRSH